ncbi:MAG: 5-methyltetrahydropteroyltriglutamate--homocysteine S-methyltransferase [Xanthobacteraceae bacterium]
MKRAKPPFRADHVGSLLRPAALKEAKAQQASGKISAAELRAIEDREIARIIDKQQSIGLQGITDGEFRREMWHRDFLRYLGGVSAIDTDAPYDWGGVKGAALNLRISGKLDFPADHPHLDHFRFVKDRTTATAKMTIPSPSVIAPAKLYDMQDANAPAYRDLDQLYEDLCAAYRKAVRAFYDAGCRYLQIDEVRMVAVADPKFRATRSLSDADFARLVSLFDRLVSGALRDRPSDMTITMHNCRGNFRSRWAAEGSYEAVADKLFNINGIDAYFLEYDSARAGGFEPLRFLPKHKLAVLGVVTSKTGALEPKGAIKRRIDEAAKYVDLDRLCLSPQCGFASTEEGNDVSEDQQWAKLSFVREIADEVWGRA